MNKQWLSQMLAMGAALVLPCVASAQSQDSDTRPKPPYLAPMPENSTWVVDLTNSATTGTLPPGARVVNQLIYAKSGADRQRTSMWTDGSKSQVWFWKGYRLEQNPGSSEISVSGQPGAHDFQDADFSDLAWLSDSNYVGLEDQEGHDCYHFKMEVKLDRPPITIEYSAYIERKTKRPVTWDVGPNHFRLSSFTLRKPDDPLVLPDAFAEKLKAYRLTTQKNNPLKKP